MENSLKNFDETEAEMPDFNAAILEALAASNLPIASSNRLSQIPTPAIIPSEHSKFFENSGITVIGPSTNLEGNGKSESACVIFGRVNGNVTAPRIVLEIGSYVEGNLNSRSVKILGTLNGNIICDEATVSANGKIRGNIAYETIEMDRGSEIVGSLWLKPNSVGA
jgi:cytoskeletal protein CcmA (bactofilin family)